MKYIDIKQGINHLTRGPTIRVSFSLTQEVYDDIQIDHNKEQIIKYLGESLYQLINEKTRNTFESVKFIESQKIDNSYRRSCDAYERAMKII